MPKGFPAYGWSSLFCPLTSQFPRLFYWHVVRHVRRHKLLAALNIISIALGVAVYLAIQVANHSANQSFAASIDLVAGKANLEVRAPSGVLDDSLYPKLATAPGVRAATPLVESYLTLPDYPGEYLQVLGVDLFTNPPFATFSIGDQRGNKIELDRWLDRAGLARAQRGVCEVARAQSWRPAARADQRAHGAVDRAVPHQPKGFAGWGEYAGGGAGHRLGAGDFPKTRQAQSRSSSSWTSPAARPRSRPSCKNWRRRTSTSRFPPNVARRSSGWSAASS